MKKSFNLFFLIVVVAVAVGYFGHDAAARITGYLYGDALVIGYPGTTVASIGTAGLITGSSVTTTGYLGLAPKTIATLKLITPGAAGQLYYCSDCVGTAALSSRLVVSTGTGIGAFGIISSTATAPV